MEPVRYPVFPLHSVCFPGHRLALRIFEERYQRLLRDTADHPYFVVALIRSGEEVGAMASPYRVGTLVQFENVEKQGDFQFIRPRGLRRLYLDSFDRETGPYLRAACAPYSDEAPIDPAALREIEARILAAAVPDRAVERVESLLAASREQLDAENYSLFLCGCLRLPAMVAQRLLECRAPARRIADALQVLRGRPSP